MASRNYYRIDPGHFSPDRTGKHVVASHDSFDDDEAAQERRREERRKRKEQKRRERTTSDKEGDPDLLLETSKKSKRKKRKKDRSEHWFDEAVEQDVLVDEALEHDPLDTWGRDSEDDRYDEWDS